MSPDPNSLYSTVAPISGAFTVLIGGFLIVRIAALMTEKAKLKKELNDKKTQLDTLIKTYGDPTRITGVTKSGEKIEIPTKPVSQRAKETSSFQAEVSNLETDLIRFAYPSYLKWGLLVLGYLITFGILLPVIAIGKGIYSDAVRTLTIVTFWIGLMGIFAYIVFLIRTLRRS